MVVTKIPRSPAGIQQVPVFGSPAKARWPPAVSGGHRANLQSDRLNCLGFVSHDFGEHAGVYVIEKAEDVYMLWCPSV
jgi:hypothetical protein